MFCRHGYELSNYGCQWIKPALERACKCSFPLDSVLLRNAHGLSSIARFVAWVNPTLFIQGIVVHSSISPTASLDVCTALYGIFFTICHLYTILGGMISISVGPMSYNMPWWRGFYCMVIASKLARNSQHSTWGWIHMQCLTRLTENARSNRKIAEDAYSLLIVLWIHVMKGIW